jgi:hypothetical protein
LGAADFERRRTAAQRLSRFCAPLQRVPASKYFRSWYVSKVSSLFGVLGLVLVFASPRLAHADPIQDYVDQPISTKSNGTAFTTAEVQEILVKAAIARRWVPRVDGPGKLTASVLVRGKHYAEVTIPFSSTSYSILYATSRELDANEKKRKIHGKYNQWVGSLNAEFSRAFAMAATAP